MRALRTSVAAIAVTGLMLVAFASTPVAAASSVVECGQLAGYTAPDPAGPTDGSVQLGLSSTWTILAAATISPAAAAALPTSVDNGPTCLAMDLDDDGNVTALDFAPTGTLTGDVDFDVSGYYILASRLLIPTTVTDAYPGLGALFATSYEAGTTLSITFTIDMTTGGIAGFDGTAAFCGRGSVTAGGDGKVGDAVIPAAVLDPDDLDALDGAGSRQTCATVHSTGTIDSETGAINITTDVDIVVAAAGATVTPPPTSTVDAGPAPARSAVPLVTWSAIVFISGLALTLTKTRRARR